MKIISTAMQILLENYRMSEEEISFKEWAEREAENDPGFYNWLFGNAENIDDFGKGMTTEQEMEAAEFFGYIGAESNNQEAIKKEDKEIFG